MPPVLDKDALAAALPALPDWRFFDDSLHARFDAPDFSTAITLVERIATAAEELNHHPDVDIRWKRVGCTLSTHSANGVTELDLTLAERISAQAKELDASSAPGLLRKVEVAIDCMDPAAIQEFWRVGLGLQVLRTAQGAQDLVDPSGVVPAVWFQKMSEPRSHRNRIHLDIYLPPEEVQDRVSAVLGAGGRLVTDEHAPSWWVLADVEGNELCICV